MAHVERRVRTGKDGKPGAVRWRVAKGAWVDPSHSRMTFAEWVSIWEGTLVHLRPRTKQLNVGVAHNYLVPRFGSWPLDRLTTSDVNEMLKEELAEGRLSNSAIRRHVMVLAQILDGAVQSGRLGRNIARGVKLPPERSRQMRFLTSDEVAHLADSLELFYRPMVLAAAYVGLRRGELSGLALTSVDPLRKTMRVDRQLQDVNGEMTPKTRAGTRTVSVPRTLIEILAPHFATPQVQASGLAFPSIKGKPLTLAFVWIYHGIIPKLLYPDAGELDLLNSAGAGFGNARLVLTLLGLGEAVFGLVILRWWRQRWPFLLTLLAMPALTLGALAGDRAAFVRPFNPITLNLALMALAGIALLTRDELPSGRSTIRRAPSAAGAEESQS